MNESQFKRRVKAIIKAIQTDNIRSLSIKDCQWLLENYWLRPQDYWDLMYDWKRYSKKDFEKFYSTFDLFEDICNEVDLNYALTWILHWVERRANDTPEALKSKIQSLENFKQRCQLVHEVRDAIGLKTYHIHYLYSSHTYKRGDDYNTYNKFKKSIVSMYARSVQEVESKFLKQYKTREKDLVKFDIKRIRQVHNRALYVIRQDPRMTPSVWKFLTTADDTTFPATTFDA